MMTRYIVEIYIPGQFTSIGCANYTQLMKVVRDNRNYYNQMKFYFNVDNSNSFKEVSLESLLKKEY